MTGRYFLIVMIPIFLSLGACGAPGQLKVTGTQTVEVPLPVRCTVPNITPPTLVFDMYAKPTDSLFKKTQLLAAQDQALKGYADTLISALNICATAQIPLLPNGPTVAQPPKELGTTK